ncbi:hypothetical protein [Synechococcus elongatus]|nr:hypothetical protein [Synechococcus elongatus]MBD2586558.1 hypothetical protein [Synechococcus elongatus FACHB-242]MBD2687632.1 hypothetical protein [Synechococcus elongatus FACHB-1061]MBD2706659.1 hypothetical protein [Synechococcus elongatus PCC 7942 = FACHB-805]WKW04799.1 hypothetical protein QY054_09410 [Synechococcus elongatus PCC 7942 = FACHB-805]
MGLTLFSRSRRRIPSGRTNIIPTSRTSRRAYLRAGMALLQLTALIMVLVWLRDTPRGAWAESDCQNSVFSSLCRDR